MSTYRLNRIFAPHSIAMVGVSAREGSVGRIVLGNLRAAGFAGPIHLVHPNVASIDGVQTIRTLADLSDPVDLVVIATPPETVPDIVAQAGARGCQGALILTAGLGHGEGSHGEQARRAARTHGLRLIGPNCLGLMVPGAGLNASFAARAPIPGNLALLSQSGAVAAGILEWAATRRIGFSAVVSLGDIADVDFGDCLDHFVDDPATRAILIYMESVTEPRKFFSAARAAARTKPVIVMKAGRHATGAKAAATHTGARAGADAVYDAVFRRAGLIRAITLDDLFIAAEALSRVRPFRGEHLAILTNGGGVGVLAADRLEDLGLAAPALDESTIARLDAFLPATWSRANPVDIIGDAGPARFSASLDALWGDTQTDAILAMQVPTALARADEAAVAIIETVTRQRRRMLTPKPVFAAWIGAGTEITDKFAKADIPQFATEAEAVEGFAHLVNYSRAQTALMETPPTSAEFDPPAPETARAILDVALAEGRRRLDPIEASRLVAAYGIAVAPAAQATDAESAALAAAPMLEGGGAVVLKILSRDIIHKSDVGGVVTGLASQADVMAAAKKMIDAVRSRMSDARIDGLLVQQMIARPHTRELIMGVASDPAFGPMILFGAGGVAVDILDDTALALPPLDLKLAHELIARTRVSRLLRAYRNVPGVNANAIAEMLVRLSRLVCDLPEIEELDFNPVLAGPDGAWAVDVRIAIAPHARPSTRVASANPRLTIRPYPRGWERDEKLASGLEVHVRPVRPSDEVLIGEMLTRVEPEDIRFRFFSRVGQFTHAFLARLTQLDYARAMAFVALEKTGREALGFVWLYADANHEKGEYAILVRSDHKGKGLGWTLMRRMIDWARSEGLRAVEGQVLAQNIAMLNMARELGFEEAEAGDDRSIRSMTLKLE